MGSHSGRRLNEHARAATDEWIVTFTGIVAYAEHDAFIGRKLLGETGETALDPQAVRGRARPQRVLHKGARLRDRTAAVVLIPARRLRRSAGSGNDNGSDQLPSQSHFH